MCDRNRHFDQIYSRFVSNYSVEMNCVAVWCFCRDCVCKLYFCLYTFRSAHTPMSKEELSSFVSVPLFNGETQQLTITLENIGSEEIETLELTSKIANTKGELLNSFLNAASLTVLFELLRLHFLLNH